MPLRYDMRSMPLVVGRVPAFPLNAALRIMDAANPLEAVRDFFERDAHAMAALEVSSPSLAGAVCAWIAGEPLRNPKTPLRALAYALRMCARPTPFGLCASIGSVQAGDAGTLRLKDDDGLRRTYTRPDMSLLMAIASEIERSELRTEVLYVRNGCVVERGGRLFVTDVTLSNIAAQNGMAMAKQRAVSLKNTEAVAFVRLLCAQPRSHGAIVGALGERFGAPPNECARLVDQLCNAGVLLSEFRRSPVGDPVSELARRFAEIGAPCASALSDALAYAEKADTVPVRARSREDYRGVAQRFAALRGDCAESAVQVDACRYFDGALPMQVLADVERFAEYAVRMGAKASLSTMRERFLQRYEGFERVVPLLELLDENIGIGFPGSIQYERGDTAKRNEMLTRIACNAQRMRLTEIELDEPMLACIAPPLSAGELAAPSLEIGFQIAAADGEAVERGDYLVVPSILNVSDAAGKSIGRFAAMLGESFTERMRQVVRANDPPGTLCAEFAFSLKDARAYNVAIRPRLYDEELHAGIGAPRERETISPDDVWVGIDRGRFYLWSNSRNKRIEIRESHAFGTPFGAPDLCRFLSMVRYDGMRMPSVFDWGPASGCTYLPRVRVGRLILSLRRWNLDSAAVRTVESFDRFRSVWDVPRYVYLCDDDRRLFIDCESAVALPLIQDQHASDRVITFVEALPLPGDLWVRGEDGAHIVEFVAQGVAAECATTAVPRPAIGTQHTCYGPGSEWIFAKFYLGAQSMEHFLTSLAGPLAVELHASAQVDRWFFVRYGDPDPHVRLRLHAGERRSAHDRLAEAAEEWLRAGVILRWALDTYSPEYERYGPDVAAVERFFTENSSGCLTVLSEGAHGERLVHAAAASFDPYLRGESYERLVLEAFAVQDREKLAAADRQAVREIGAAAPRDCRAFEGAMACSDPHARLIDLLHMHCNRLGLDGPGEQRVRALLRACVLGRRARRKAYEPVLTGSYT